MQNRHIKVVSPPYQWENMSYGEVQRLIQFPEIREVLKKANIDEYLHWEELQYKAWIPKNFFPDKELFWTFLSLTRLVGSSLTPIQDANGNNFIMKTDSYSEYLHHIDMEMGGNFMGIANLTETSKKEFITRSIIEESIASSQLEGANTSRVVAKRMLVEGRSPTTPSEQMIVNNHKVMLLIEQDLFKEKLSLEVIFKLHKIILNKTIHESKQGKLRETFDENNERLKVKLQDKIAYVTPDKEFVEIQLPRLIAFANDEDGSGYIHPLIKAIMIHFWIGLLHPFEDGNGRLARVLFYWYMLRKEYWAFKYVSISEKIKKSKEQYAQAYIYSEQDRYDLTYFINFNIKKLLEARKEFKEYIKIKINENHKLIVLGQNKYGFNERQLKLLQYLNKKMEERASVLSYQTLYSIKKGTAILDLKELVEKKFLIKKKFGRNVFYYPTSKVSKLF